MSGGGLDTVRGYLESEVLGDNGILESLELRSPYLPGLFGRAADKFFIDDWRAYLFGDVGLFTINAPLPDQQDTFRLASVGIGSRIRLFHHLNGSVDLALPLITQVDTKTHDARLSFRAWVEF